MLRTQAARKAPRCRQPCSAQTSDPLVSITARCQLQSLTDKKKKKRERASTSTMPLYILSACRPADMTFAVDPAQAGTRMRGIARLAPSAAVLLLQVSLNPYSPSPLVQPSAIQEIEILEQKAVVRRREKKVLFSAVLRTSVSAPPSRAAGGSHRAAPAHPFALPSDHLPPESQTRADLLEDGSPLRSQV